MSFIETVDEEKADPATAALYERSKAGFGYLPNMARIFSHRPDVFDAWTALNTAIKAHMDLRRYELATLAAARELRSSYCMLAHGKVLLGGMVDEAGLSSILDDPASAELSGAEQAVMRFAAKVVRDAASVEQSDVQELRDLGLSDAEIFDVATAAAVRCFFSKTLDALGARPDAAYRSLPEPLVARLVVGRSIDDRRSDQPATSGVRRRISTPSASVSRARRRRSSASVASRWRSHIEA